MNYKGEETYNTAIGGCITLCVYALTLVMIVNAVDEIFGMHDPDLKEYEKPMSISEEEEWLPFQPSDYNFKLVLLPLVFTFASPDVTFGVPPEIGTLMIHNEGDNVTDELELMSLSNCTDAFTDKQLNDIERESHELHSAMFQGQAYCLPPDFQVNSLSNGASNDEAELGRQQVFLSKCFKSAWKPNCFDEEERKAWESKNSFNLVILQVKTGVDFSSKSDYLFDSISEVANL